MKQYNENIKGYFKTFDNTKLFYSIEGSNKENTPLFFLHGLVCTKSHWKYQIDYFKSKRQTIWMDYRGHRNSQLPDDISSINIQTIAKDVITLLKELNISKVILIGHSMGVNIALEVAMILNQKKNNDSDIEKTIILEKLILANGTPKDPLETMFNSNLSHNFFNFIKSVYYKFPIPLAKIWKLQAHNFILHKLVSQFGFNKDLVKLEDVKEFISNASKTDITILINLLENMTLTNQTPWLSEITIPTLIIAGEKDLITPSNTQKILKQLMPISQMIIIKDGSHCPQLDMADIVNKEIETFINSN